MTSPAVAPVVAPTSPGVALANLLEKIAWTYTQAFLGFWMLSDNIGDASTAQVAAMAAIPAALTLVMNAVAAAQVANLPFALDVLFRALRTYVAGFLGLLLAQPTFTLDYSILAAAATAAVPAALAVVKAAAATRLGEHGTAATLPRTLDLAA